MPPGEFDAAATGSLPTEPTGRRALLRASAGATTGALAAGLAGPAAAQAFGGWFEDVPNYDGTVTDYAGESAVTVEVGVETEVGPYGFGPPAIRIDPGTTVTFSWVSDTHNVLPEAQPQQASWEGHEPIENSGFEYEHTFGTEGVYRYFCEPHRALGMKGAVVVGTAPAGEEAGGQEGGDDGGLSLTPGIAMVGTAVALAVLSPVAFALFLLRGRGRAADGGERVGDGGGTSDGNR